MARNWLLGDQAMDLIPNAYSYALKVAKQRPSTEYSNTLY